MIKRLVAVFAFSRTQCFTLRCEFFLSHRFVASSHVWREAIRMPGLSLFSSGKLKKSGVEDIGIRNAFIQIVPTS
jgi:hypothetical protein